MNKQYKYKQTYLYDVPNLQFFKKKITIWIKLMHCMGYTGLQKNYQEQVFNIQLAFLLLSTNMKAIFSITSRISEILGQLSKNQQNRMFLGCVYAEVNQ